MEQTKYDVFISYSRKDYIDEENKVIPNNVVSTIKEALTQAEITYWFDEEGIYSGQNFVEKIITNIEASKIFLFLSTANANKSKWTCKEIASADEIGKHIIPVRIDSTPYNKKILFRIADLDYIEYYINPEKGMSDLINSIKTYLDQILIEEKKKLEEEERQKEIERQKAEDEKKQEELRLKRFQEEQEKMITNIKLACTKLNNEETKIELDRKNLLLSTEKIANNEQRDLIKKYIISTSPIRKKNQEELLILQNKVKELEMDSLQKRDENRKLNEKLINANNSLSKLGIDLSSATSELAKKKKELENSRNKIEKYQRKLADTNIGIIGTDKKTHYIYGGIILLLLVFMGWKSCQSPHDLVTQPDGRDSLEIGHASQLAKSELKDSIDAILNKLSTIDPLLERCLVGYENGDIESTYKLGKYFEVGDFLEGNKNLYVAGKLIHIAANSGFGEAQNTLGFYFFHGRAGYTLNYDSATFWYSEAIKNGSIDALYNLALAYDDGRYKGTRQSTKRTADALTLYKKSAESGSSKSQVALGIYYYNNKKYKDAKLWIETGLNGSLPSFEESKAQFMMGQLYGTGKPGVTHNDKIAFTWYQKSATNGEGYLEALYYMGIYYQNGRGVKQDLTKAQEWFIKAANRGHQQAKEKLSGKLK